MTRLTIDKLPLRYQEQIRAQLGQTAPPPNKYRAQPTADAEGRIHPSKIQAGITDDLRAGGAIVIPEVSIPLSTRPRDRIRIDALVIDAIAEDGVHFTGRFVEVKGLDLSTGVQKRMRFTDAYGIEIEVRRKR